MRRERIIIGACFLVIAALFAVPGAYAAEPIDIARDLADGRLDGNYTQAELSAYLQNATIQGYNPPTCEQQGNCTTVTPPTVTPLAETPPAVTPPAVTPPAVTPPAVTPPAGGIAPVATPVTPEAQVAGVQSPVVSSAPQATPPTASVAGVQSPPLAATRQVGALPFTGIDLALLVAGGLLLLMLGLGARRAGRTRA